MWRWFCSSQGVDYLKYDNCNNGGLKPLERCVARSDTALSWDS